MNADANEVTLERVPEGAQNEHVVMESGLDWLPQGARVFLEPAPAGTYDNAMLHEKKRYYVHNVRVLDASGGRTRTALEVGQSAR